MAESAVEKRIFDRIPLFIPAEFLFPASHEGERIFLSDISSEGLRLKTQKRLFYGEEIQLKVSVPNQTTEIMLQGRVAWARIRGDHMWDVGLRFENPLLVKMASLYQLLTAQANLNY